MLTLIVILIVLNAVLFVGRSFAHSIGRPHLRGETRWHTTLRNPVNQNLMRLARCETGYLAGGRPNWQHSNATYVIYLATDPDIVRRHASAGGFPVDSISEVRSVIDPTTAD